MVVVLETKKLHGHHTARLLYDSTTRLQFRVDLYHPNSGWVFAYNCGTLRKAIAHIDGPLMEESKK